MLTLPASMLLAVLASVAAVVGKTAQASDVDGARLLTIPFRNRAAARVNPFSNTCFSKKLPTTCSEQCCSLFVVQRIFPGLKGSRSAWLSVFSVQFLIFFFGCGACEIVPSSVIINDFIRRMIGRSVMANP